MNLQKAILVSVIGHTLVLSPVGGFKIFKMFRAQETYNDMQVTYYKVSPPKTTLQKQIKASNTRQRPPKPNKTITKTRPQEKADTGTRVISGLSEELKVKIEKNRKKIEKLKKELIKKPVKKQVVRETIPGTTLPKTPECIHYYNHIRSKIQQFLEDDYRFDHGEGMVAVTFALNRRGEIAYLKVNKGKSSGEPVHYQLAYESVKGASPFGAFPEGLDLTQISFNLTIVFTEK